MLGLALVSSEVDMEEEEEEDEEEDEVEVTQSTRVAKPRRVYCPQDCSCMVDGVVDCAGVDLKEFPTELSEDTRQLSLQVSRPQGGAHQISHWTYLVWWFSRLSPCVPEQPNWSGDCGGSFGAAPAGDPKPAEQPADVTW